MGEDEVACLREAARQEGVLRRDQALRWLSAKQVQGRLASGAWERVFPRVFRVVGAPVGWRQSLRALCLWAGTGFALSHRTAAELHRLSRFRAQRLELSVTRHLVRPGACVVHEVQPFGRGEVEVLQGLPVTSATRTLFDLASLDDVRLDDLRASVDQALREKKTSVERLEVSLARCAGHRGAGRMRRILVELQGGGGPTESELEARVLELIRGAGLPVPERQRTVIVGGRLRRVDFRYPGARVIVEADGYAYHSNVIAFEKDRQRRNSLITAGYEVLQWTWKALEERPFVLIQELVTVLARRGS